jgi:hypothetical protein
MSSLLSSMATVVNHRDVDRLNAEGPVENDAA